MSRPDKFQIMRAKRKPSPEVELQALIRRMEQLEAEETAKWHAPRRPFAFEAQGLGQLGEALEVDIDAVHSNRNRPVRRWFPKMFFNRG